MAEPLELNPNYGSKEAHAEVMKARLAAAEAEYQRALEKGIPELIETTKQLLDNAEAEYKSFVQENEVAA